MATSLQVRVRVNYAQPSDRVRSAKGATVAETTTGDGAGQAIETMLLEERRYPPSPEHLQR